MNNLKRLRTLSPPPTREQTVNVDIEDGASQPLLRILIPAEGTLSLRPDGLTAEWERGILSVNTKLRQRPDGDIIKDTFISTMDKGSPQSKENSLKYLESKSTWPTPKAHRNRTKHIVQSPKPRYQAPATNGANYQPKASEPTSEKLSIKSPQVTPCDK